MKAPITVLETAKMVHADWIAAQKKLIAKSKASAKAKEKQLGGNRIKATHREMEGILRKYGIDRGAHHGGELVVGGCRLLMSKAEAIFGEI